MKFTEIRLKGAYFIDIEPRKDQRGFFARSFCQKEFEHYGIQFHVVQCNISYNTRKGTLRGMHYQVKPHEEAKLVQCIRGAIYDVIIDLRPKSPTFKQWAAFELTAENHRMLYIPEGFAHGFQTLEDHSEVFYQISEFHHPKFMRGVRGDDPTFEIEWPNNVQVISERDRQYPDFIL